jgi:hypothetical protein
MVAIKKKEQFFECDPTNGIFPGLSLETRYEFVSQYCSLHDGVPEDVHSYFNAIVTLYLYGWLYYPFHTLASERSFFVVEMALRKRLPPQKLNKRGRDPRFLRALLEEAERVGLLQGSAVNVGAFVEMRNHFAHPKMQEIMPPGMALDPLIAAAEIINRLWPKPASS